MSVLSRKRAAEAAAADTPGRLRQLARPVVLARAAGPIAKSAGVAARDGARSAGAWAAPHIDGARAWTAPRIERSGIAIRDTVAPRICETLTATARRIDVNAAGVDVAAPRRRWAKVVATTAILGAAGAAAAILLRRRKDNRTCGAPGEETGPGTGQLTAQDGQQRAGADGIGPAEDVRGKSTAI